MGYFYLNATEWFGIEFGEQASVGKGSLSSVRVCPGGGLCLSKCLFISF